MKSGEQDFLFIYFILIHHFIARKIMIKLI